MKKQIEEDEHKLKLVHLLEIKLNFSANLITEVDSVLKVQAFLQNNAQIDPQKIGELYFLSGLTLYDNKYQDRQAQSTIL